MEVALLIWAAALTVLVIVGVVWVLDLQAQTRRLKENQATKLVLGEGEEAGLTGAVEALAARLAETTARTERLTAHSQETDAALAHAVQSVGLVRFRAFEDTGGDQSFALALTDGEGNGVVVSALYGRDATRIYAKPVEAWRSSKPLGTEEEQALAQSRQNLLGQR
jgi:hypothetical protein